MVCSFNVRARSSSSASAYLLRVVQALKVVVLGELALSRRLSVDIALAEVLPEGEAARWA